MNDKISKALSTLIEESFADEKEKQNFLAKIHENKNKSIENKLNHIEIEIKKLNKKIDYKNDVVFYLFLIIFIIMVFCITFNHNCIDY